MSRFIVLLFGIIMVTFGSIGVAGGFGSASPAHAGGVNDPETTLHSHFYRTQSGVSYEVVKIPGFGKCLIANGQGTAMVCK